MSYIYELEPKHYAALLATKELDIADKDAANSVGEGKIPPDNRNRTILIGLGGTGVQTLDHIKRVISSKLAPNWKEYIAFLAIDTDDNELKNATHLTQEEFVKVTKPGIQNTVNKGLEAYPKAWRSFVDEDQARTLVGFGSMGAGRKRLMGKMKLHYKVTGSKGVDEEIVAKLVDRKNNVLQPFTGKDSGHYEVYVIGSVSGGTCSGSFLEMPALVRKALAKSEAEHARVQLHAMLYLPDTLTALDPDREEELKANGYASLKELDYFEGLNMREGSEEHFSYNENATADLKVTSDHDFFTMPYLIGTRSGANSSSKDEACQTIAEFFVSILGTMTTAGDNAFLVDSFLSNAMQYIGERFNAEGNDELEAFGTDHSRPKRYGTVGFAQAAAPEQIVKAYTIAHACKVAGLEPITEVERKNQMAAGKTMLPFYGEDQYFSVSEVTRRSRELLAPLLAFMNSYQYTGFEYKTLFGENPTWEEIRSGSADGANQDVRVNMEVERLTNSDAINQQKERVSEQFIAFKKDVEAFVLQEGPFAFVNLYEGRASKNDAKEPDAVGIRAILNRLCNDQNLDTATANNWPTVAGMLEKKQKKAEVITEAPGGLKGLIDKFMRDKQTTDANNWVNAYNAWVNARVNETLRKEMLFTNGALNQNFIVPAAVLCEQLYAFGKIMQEMAKSYSEFGKDLNNYDDFKKVDGGNAQVNIAALNTSVHAYLKNKAEKNAKAVNAQGVRNALIESFFADPNKWMEIDDNNIERRGGGSQISLKNSKNPIGARYEFDRCLRQQINMSMEVQIADLFAASGVNEAEFAQQIVDKLNRQSQPLFNGTLPDNSTYRYIMYPQSLKDSVKEAIEKAAAEECGTGVGFYATQYADSIMMHQLVAPFEMYNLAELKEWESQYATKISETGNGLHGRSPDLAVELNDRGTPVYSERTTWYDYPSVTFDADPKRKSKDGKRSHEGEVRVSIDEVIKEARKKGILYVQNVNTDQKRKENDRFVINRVYLDGSTDWSFDADLLMPNSKGLYPEDVGLLRDAVEVQNGKKMADVTRVVKLAFAGQLEKAHKTPEKAWEYAARTLYVHRPMLNEIRDTLAYTDGWYKAVAESNEEIRKENEEVAKELNPARVYRLMQAHVFYRNDAGMWLYEDENGREIPVVNMNSAVLKRLKIKSPKDAAVVDAGFTLFYICGKLVERLSFAELDAAVQRAQSILEEYHDEDVLNAATDQAEDMVTAELKILSDLGGDVEEYEKQTAKFYKAMEALRIKTKEQVDEICKFYNKIQLWEEL